MPSYEADHAEFERYDAQVVGISVDSKPSHVAWAKSLGGIQSYPLTSDFHEKGAVSKTYGVYKDEAGICERAIVIVDKHGKIAFIDVHDISEQPDNLQLVEFLRDLQ